MRNRYDVWSDALINTYTGDIYGVTLGAHYPDVLRWISAMRPYPARKTLTLAAFYDVAYAITHVIYTLNNYGMYRLSPAWLPQPPPFGDSTQPSHRPFAPMPSLGRRRPP